MKDQIQKLKKEKNAIILAHYYAPSQVQEIADLVGDSFYLAKAAKQTEADVIVFCGVRFMGESAKILNPDKTVLMPDLSADCPMAHMASVEKIEELREAHEDLAVVCYINSSAALKCHSDVCVTSSNAVKIVRALPNKNIYFIPDQHLGRFIARQVPEKNFILNDGYCPVHAAIGEAQLLEEKRRHPDAPVLSHPECAREILELSDFIGSTAQIIDFANAAPAGEFIICTEDGVEHKLRLNDPDKRFYFPEPRPCCPDMKRNTLEAVLHVLETGDHAVEISEEVQQRALLPLERMLELAR